MNIVIHYLDGTFKEQKPVIDNKNQYKSVKPPIGLNYKIISYIDFCGFAPKVIEGDNGYAVFQSGQLGLFIGKEGLCNEFDFNCLPIFGVKSPSACVFIVIAGMRFNAKLFAECKNGIYNYFIRFSIDGSVPYEKIKIDLYELHGDNADYSGMARVYRNRQLESGACVPLKERMNDTLNYTMNSVYIRIRMAWKPAPPTVLEQTDDNEPPMHVACTFGDVERLMTECHRQGIEKAEFCLVGWNYRGHDGRWPQIFPVEPELGGESGLKSLISTAKRFRYRITCHTNSTDAYSVADCWDDDLIAKNQDGNLADRKDAAWSGGRQYYLCAKKAYEMARHDLPQVSKLGFQGTHYIDVISALPPRPCFDKKHTLNYKKAAEYNNRILKLGKRIFGGIASEGGYDFCAGILDFALYTSFIDPFAPSISTLGKESKLADKCIPLWQLIYHGIIISNPFAKTVNSNAKGIECVHKAREFGARPVFYYYSNFMTDTDKSDAGNWMGNTDFTFDTEEELRESVAKIKDAYDDYAARAYLQTEFMEKHKEIGRDTYEITYSNGVKEVVNYSSVTDSAYESFPVG